MTLIRDGDRVVLAVTDDGRGFAPASVRERDGSLGLRGMAERAEALGSRLTVESAPGAGTRVKVRCGASVGSRP